MAGGELPAGGPSVHQHSVIAVPAQPFSTILVRIHTGGADMAEESKRAPLIFAALPTLFIAVTVLTYVTGFLVASAFLDRYGLKDSGAELLKVKYLQTGIMFLVFPIILISPVISFAYLKRTRRAPLERPEPATADASGAGLSAASNGDKVIPLYTPTILVITNLLVVFYILALFAPFGHVTHGGKRHFLMALFLVSLFGLLLAQIVVKKAIKADVADKAAVNLRWVVFAACLILDVYVLGDLLGVLENVAYPGTMYFMGFMSLIAYIAWRVYVRIDETGVLDKNVAIVGLAVGIAAALFYLSVLTFALLVFPYIPAAKGGGDFSEAPIIIVRAYPRYKESIPPELFDSAPNDLMRLRSMIMFEERTSSIFIADPNEAGGPSEWRHLGSQKPQIFEIRREAIGSVTYRN
jgi:hypothetical protein